jgi:hypothetical protein
MQLNTMQSGKYTRSRVVLILSAVPQHVLAEQPELTGSDYDFAKNLLTVGGITRMTTIRAIRQRTNALLKECQRRVKKREFSAVFKLIDEEPWFVCHPWVQDMFKRFADHPRFVRKPGRRKGKHRMHPFAVKDLVDCLVRASTCSNRAKAYGLIEQCGLMAEETARRLYGRAVNDRTPQGVLIEFPDEMQYLTEEEVQAVRASAELLTPGAEIRRVIDDEKGMPIEVSFKGGAPGAPTREFLVFDRISIPANRGDNN